MCGIAGTIALNGTLDPRLRAAIAPMIGALAHRGPDGLRTHTGETMALGHARLAIIDRAGGWQPMATADGGRWIVFNGEIYNHRDLRRRLESRGYRFRTTSDTEAILHAYDAFGDHCVGELEGMFAFAIYDTRRRTALLARDRLGKKPLFYATLDGALHFASEIKALRRSPAWDGTLDWSALEGYLSLGYFLAPDTIYRHVKQVEPGHLLTLRSGRVESRRYWEVTEFDTERRPDADVAGSLDGILRRAVEERLESEVPLGAFLSGGIDSGLIVSYMQQASASPVITTTVDFGAGIYDEARFAAQTAAHLRTQHHCDIVTPDLGPVLDPIVDGFDQPFADPSAIPTYYLSAMARRHVTVALSGDGGDEAFGGYASRYIPHAYEARARGLLGRSGAAVAGWLGARWPRSTQLPRWLRAGTVLENLGRDAAAAYYADLCMLKPHETRALLGRDPDRDPRHSPVFEQVTRPYRQCPSGSDVQRAQFADLKIYLPNDVLVKVDRMSMAHGLEVRAPLLDRRVVEAAFRIPAERKLAGGRSKYFLRALARTRLPEPIVNRRKHGFDAPIGRWIAGPLRGAFNNDVMASASPIRSMLDDRVVAAMLRDHTAGHRDHSFALWAVWVLARWSIRTGSVARLDRGSLLSLDAVPSTGALSVQPA
jgi:asparagine synthase (glutamine-hydrolysing)